MIKENTVEQSTPSAILPMQCYVQGGDNLELLKSQPNESVNMIYCDILYGTGRNFGDYQDLKPIRSEIESHYLPRLIEMKRVLKQNGTIYLQMDEKINHWMRILMDDVFGYNNYRNTIIWHYNRWTAASKDFQRLHDCILRYTVSDEYTFNIQYKDYTEGSKERKKNTLHRFKNGEKYLVTETKGVPQNDVWTDIPFLPPSSNERKSVKYNTQKPKELIKRFVLASTNEGDVVADYYLGSGTTAKVCQELNRNFIGCDLNPKAIEITKGRLNGGQ